MFDCIVHCRFLLLRTVLRRPDGDGRIESLSNDHGDGNENGKKAISSHYYDVKVPIPRVVENSEHKTTTFLNFDTVF